MSTIKPNNLNQGASEAERAAPCPFCGSENVKAHVYSAILAIDEPDAYCQCGDCSTTGPNGTDEASAIVAWNRRTPAATTGDGELPPLPAPDRQSAVTGDKWYSAEAVEAIRRAAIEADRAQQAGAAASSVKPWQERESAYETPEFSQIERMDAEIADLRAQLAAKGQGEPVAWFEAEPGARGRPVKEVIGSFIYSTRFHTKAAPVTSNPVWPLYAVPASAQPADDCYCGGFGDVHNHGCPEDGAQPDQRESAAAPDEPSTFMTSEQAEKWAWEQVKRDVGTEGWTVGDSCNYFGFFLWGWRYRAQYERQRNVVANEIRLAAAPAAQPVAKDEPK